MQRTGGAWSPDVFAERDSFTPEPLAAFRKAAEDTVLAAAGDGVRAMVVRPGLIWGPGDHGHVPMVYRSVATTGAAAYVGPGLNTYSHVHIDDVTRLFTLALAGGRAGGLYHAVAGETPTAGSRNASPPTSGWRRAASLPGKPPGCGASSAPSSWPRPAASEPSTPGGSWAGTPSAPTC
ncbi:NAD-dependent epimerase/dehydratase family protein [Streptomyces cyaneofuscatus]|uniref:NAD-dependent epimerase/dehydratase family protein n=1 Tax=Streptomyces cyaneofuscatus TaxID=66883 RepID=UPI001EF3C67E|nr:NAD-dependent epimerase/dehydratase family protein [Streptomyces cyaneofuscatus]